MATPDPRLMYEQWVRSYAAELFRFAYRLTGNRQLTEDLVQETFTEAWKSIQSQRDPGRARAWLFQILRYRYAHHIRDGKARLRAGVLHDGVDVPDRAPAVLDALGDRELLQNALDELSPEVRETFLLVFMQGLKCREAAEEQHVPLGTVLSRLNRARTTLRSRLRVDGSRARISHTPGDIGELDTMAENNGNSLDPSEVATLSPDDPRREAFARTLTDPAVREAWECEWESSDGLRGMLASVDVPGELERKLLAVPEVAGRVPERAAAHAATPMAVRAIAALLLLAVLATGIWLWRPWAPRPQPMSASVRKAIAVWAVNGTQRPLDVSSPDAAAVRAKLESYGMDVPVMLLTPTPGIALQGGGVCDFGDARAVYTRWAGEGYTCTLYEFNGTRVGAPPLFPLTGETPQELWQGNMHYRVLIFPGAGGKCCWALVMDTDKAVNHFASYTSGTY